MTQTREIELAGATIEYHDTGGHGPPIVLLHGLIMDASLWDDVSAALAPEYRCVAPTLPLGAHRHAMAPGADLSLDGIAPLVCELLERLELDDVTLVGVDTGGAVVQLLMAGDAERIGRVVLVSCDAFDNFPPGLTGRTLVMTGKLGPGLFGLLMGPLRVRLMRRLPISFGWLTKRGDAAVARFIRPLIERRDIRRDTVHVLRAIAARRDLLIEVSQRLPGFDRPALVVWAAEDRVMPPEHGRRLAELLPRAELVEIADSYTLIPLDQPRQLADAINGWLTPAPTSAAVRSSSS